MRKSRFVSLPLASSCLAVASITLGCIVVPDDNCANDPHCSTGTYIPQGHTGAGNYPGTGLSYGADAGGGRDGGGHDGGGRDSGGRGGGGAGNTTGYGGSTGHAGTTGKAG